MGGDYYLRTISLWVCVPLQYCCDADLAIAQELSYLCQYAWVVGNFQTHVISGPEFADGLDLQFRTIAWHQCW